MYNSYFGLSEPPFENKLDQKFLFLSEDHGEVLAALLYFILEAKGFAIVCGDVGTGKTMLINCFLERLPKYIHPIIISNPNVVYLDLLHYIAKELNLTNIKENILELSDDIKKALTENSNKGKRYMLVVDEAHLLTNLSLEDIRLLSNIETPEQKLLQILLVGQYELSHNLDRPEMRQLRQRINISRFLSPLSPAETINYINYRLTKVGSNFDSCFDHKCKNLIFRMTDGVPRRINQICDNALLICMTEKGRRVDRKILKKAGEALRTDEIFTPKSALRKNLSLRILQGAIIPAVLAGLLSIVVVLGQREFLGQNVYQLVRSFTTPIKAPPAQIQPIAGNTKGTLTAPATPAAPAPSIDPVTQNSSGQASPAKPQELLKNTSAGEAQQEPPLLSRPQELPTLVVAKERPTHFPPPKFQGTLPARQVVIKSGDYLLKIAAQWYPQNVDLGLQAIILANLKNSKVDLIHPGEVLFLPQINFKNEIIQLRNNLYYTPYENFRSFKDLQEAISFLSQHKIRYLVINSIDGSGATTHRIILGGYERNEDLEKELKKVRGRS